MPIHDCMVRHTDRQLRAWLAWFDLEMNRPSRSDFYAMQIAAEIRRSNVKNPRAVTLDSMLIKFEKKVRETVKSALVGTMNASKSVWLAVTRKRDNGKRERS